MTEPAQHELPDQQQAPPAKRLKTVAAAPLCASNNEMVEPAPHKQPLPHESSLWDKLPAEIQLLVFRFASPLTRHINNLQAFHGKTAATLDEATKLQLWIEAFKMDWQGDLALLPDVDLTVHNGLLLALSRSMYDRLCKRFPQHTEIECAKVDARNNNYNDSFTDDPCDNRRLILIPMRHGWFDLLDFTYPIALARWAIRFGCLDLLKHLDDKYSTLKNWMAHHKPTSRYWYEAIDQAAGNGHLDVIQYLFGRGVTGCTTHAMDWAAEYGHLDIVQWLHKNRTEGCTIWAMDFAAIYGHLHVVKWLHANRREGCTTSAMNLAAGEGHLHVIEWLHANRSEGCTTKAMDFAAIDGHLHVVKWLHANRHEGCTTHAMDYAARNGHLHVIKWLDANRHEGCTHAALDKAIYSGCMDIVKYMYSKGSRASRDFVIERVLAVGNDEMLRRLRECGNADEPGAPEPITNAAITAFSQSSLPLDNPWGQIPNASQEDDGDAATNEGTQYE